MLSLVVPGSFQVADARAIVRGCEEACETHGIAFVGGDTKEGASPQVVGAAWGTVEKGAGFGRTPAMPGDSLFLAGRLGGFAAALELIGTKDIANEYPPEWTDCLIHPAAHVSEGRFLRESRMVAGACDLSDGLAEALRIFCGAGVGITLVASELPIHPLVPVASERFGVPSWRYAFGVGDWAIAVIVREKDVASFRMSLEDGLELFEVGRFDGTSSLRIRDDEGVERDIPHVINEHFRRRLEDDGDYLRDLLDPR
jgi:thiamine-monophosphate kinase